MIRLLPLLLLLLVGCVEDLDLPWDLDHDRIVAVRATPPGITSGAATIDGLLAAKGAATRVATPDLAIVASPQALASVLTRDGNGTWIVQMPSAEALAMARTELGLAADAPVPLLLGVGYDGMALKATKTVILGEDRANPSVDTASIEGELMRDKPELVVSATERTYFDIEVTDEQDVNWLTSAGSMGDYDLPEAYVTFEPEDPVSGELAVVLRDENGGVAWRVWPIRAE